MFSNAFLSETSLTLLKSDNTREYWAIDLMFISVAETR
jgi:hypothetical protein